MAKSKLSDKEQIDLHISNLDLELAKCVTKLREIILATDQEVGERIKWNNPSFYYTGAMQDFDPKEYKRELIVFNLHKGKIMLVFPSGAKVNDVSGFLTGVYTDGRRIVTFENLEDIQNKEKKLQEVILTWLSLVEK